MAGWAVVLVGIRGHVGFATVYRVEILGAVAALAAFLYRRVMLSGVAAPGLPCSRQRRSG